MAAASTLLLQVEAHLSSWNDSFLQDEPPRSEVVPSSPTRRPMAHSSCAFHADTQTTALNAAALGEVRGLTPLWSQHRKQFRVMFFFFFFPFYPQCSHWMSMAQKSLVHCNVHNFSHTAV